MLWRGLVAALALCASRMVGVGAQPASPAGSFRGGPCDLSAPNQCNRNEREECGASHCSDHGECCNTQKPAPNGSVHPAPACCCTPGFGGPACRDEEPEHVDGLEENAMPNNYTYTMAVCILCCWVCCAVRRCRMEQHRRHVLRESLLQSLVQATATGRAGAAATPPGLTGAELRALRPVKCVVSELSDEEEEPQEDGGGADLECGGQQRQEEEQQSEELMAFRAITSATPDAAEEYLHTLGGGNLELAINLFFERGGRSTLTPVGGVGARPPPAPSLEWLTKKGRMSAATAAAGCVICLEAFEAGEDLLVLPLCGHSYHAKCATDWLKGHDTCPTCRADVRTPAQQQQRRAAASAVTPRRALAVAPLPLPPPAGGGGGGGAGGRGEPPRRQWFGGGGGATPQFVDEDEATMAAAASMLSRSTMGGTGVSSRQQQQQPRSRSSSSAPPEPHGAE